MSIISDLYTKCIVIFIEQKKSFNVFSGLWKKKSLIHLNIGSCKPVNV